MREINLGVKTKKARLTSRVIIWKPYLLWSFALDCLEHAYSLDRGMFTEVYKQGLRFCRAYSKFDCDKGAFELEELVYSKSFFISC